MCSRTLSESDSVVHSATAGVSIRSRSGASPLPGTSRRRDVEHKTSTDVRGPWEEDLTAPFSMMEYDSPLLSEHLFDGEGEYINSALASPPADKTEWVTLVCELLQ